MPIARKLVTTTGILIILFSLPASGQWLCEQPTNLTTNCGFDAGIADWLQAGGDSFTHAADGNYAPGSFEVASRSIMGWDASISQCINLAVGASVLDGGLWVSILSGPVDTCSLSVTEYLASDCITYSANVYESITSFPDTWNWAGRTFTLDPETSSVSLSVSCSSSTGDFVVRLDDIYLGAGLSGMIFGGGFEHGNTERWSAAVP
jgi:hypothetical protein